jgi:DNA invertase Pin-like site-specific DNA recombinase
MTPKRIVAAIYARRSKEQHVAEEAKSVTRQIANAKEFATKQGWTVSKEHIYTDDGIRGAEFEQRPGFMALIDTATSAPRSPFQYVIVSE